MHDDACGLPVVVPLTLLLIVSACAEGAEGGSGGPSSAEEPIIIPAEAVHRVGTSELISQVRDVEIDEDGTIWVLNGMAPYFIGFDTAGTVTASHGDEGGGPGEFQAPSSLARSAGGSAPEGVWTYDQGRHAMIRIDGTEEVSIPIPPASIPPRRLLTFDEGGLGGSGMGSTGRPWFEPVDDGFLMATSGDGAGYAVDFWDADLMVLARNGSASRLLETEDHVGDPATRYQGATQLLPFPLWARCADGSLVLYDPLENRLRMMSSEGVVDGSIELPPERRMEFTPDRFYQLLVQRVFANVSASDRPPDDELRASFDAEVEEARDQIADEFPEYTGLHCTGEGTLWLQRFSVDEGRFGHAPTWLRVTRGAEAAGAGNGAAPRIREVRLPEEFIALRLDEERAWGMVLDEYDVPTVAWLELP